MAQDNMYRDRDKNLYQMSIPQYLGYVETYRVMPFGANTLTLVHPSEYSNRFTIKSDDIDGMNMWFSNVPLITDITNITICRWYCFTADGSSAGGTVTVINEHNYISMLSIKVSGNTVTSETQSKQSKNLQFTVPLDGFTLVFFAPSYDA